MKKTTIFIVILSLLMITSIVTAFYLTGRMTGGKGNLLITTPKGNVIIDTTDLEFTHVEGESVNQKGEKKTITGEGMSLSEIPLLADMSDYSVITLYSDDEYKATLTKEELEAGADAWLIIGEEDLRLYVFTDMDSKRNVKNVVRIEIN